MMNKIFIRCISVNLIAAITLATLSLNTAVYAFDDDWGDDWGGFDVTVPVDEPAAAEPSWMPPPPPPPPPAATTPSFDHAPQQPALTPTPSAPAASFDSFDSFDSFSTGSGVDAASEGFVRVIRHPREGISEVQNAIVEGLQLTTSPGAESHEVIVSCFFIFRDRPSSYFFDFDRKERKLSFEFMDAQIGSSPIAALEQAPLKEIVIEAMQIDANRAIKGILPEWHDAIRITFNLEHLPVIIVNDEHNIVSFTYKWTTDPERISDYIEPNRFKTVFWASGGVLGGIGIGTLVYFLIPKKDDVISNVLKDDDLPNRNRGGR